MDKKLLKILTAISLLATLGGGFWLFQKEYKIWNGMLLRQNSEIIDISGKEIRNLEQLLEFPELESLDARGTGMTLEQYLWFRENLPRCRISWDVPVQGDFYSQDTKELTVSQLSQADMDALQYLPELAVLNVGQWEEYSQILTLRQRYPDCDVRCQVEISGEWWDSDAVSMVLKDGDCWELTEKLKLFPKLESILLTGKLPARSELQELQQKYPDVVIIWKMSALGMAMETDLEAVDFSAVTLDSTRQLEELLPYFSRLKTVELGGCELPDGELVELARKHPDIHFLFDLTIGDHTVRTDAEEIDISNTPMESTAMVEDLLHCFPNLKKVVMCRCGLSNEAMDALNQRYEDIRFVWDIPICGMWFRTDATYFTPNRWGLKISNEEASALRYCTDMVCVDIGHQMGVTDCDWVAFMPELKYLILAETSISDLTPLTGLEKLIYLELFLSRVTDYSPLTTCKALEDLNLCYTRGDPTPIGEMTWLKRLWWTGHWAAQVSLPEKLGETTYMEFRSPSSTGKGWREGQNYYDMRDLIGMHYMTG